MYTSEKSTKLTLFCTYIFCVLFAIMTVAFVPISKWLSYREPSFNVTEVSIAFYICCPLGWVTLISIIRLLKNVLKDEVFTEETVKILRIMSWCCAIVCLVCFAAFLFFRLFIIFSICSGLMMLILRVLKNVMARAVEIKNENELTI